MQPHSKALDIFMMSAWQGHSSACSVRPLFSLMLSTFLYLEQGKLVSACKPLQRLLLVY